MHIVLQIELDTLITHTHTHLFNGPFSGTTQVSQYQKGKTDLDFTEARDSEWQWHQLGHMQVCTLLQTENHASTPPLFFTGRMPFLSPNQQRQSTEGNTLISWAEFALNSRHKGSDLSSLSSHPVGKEKKTTGGWHHCCKSIQKHSYH